MYSWAFGFAVLISFMERVYRVIIGFGDEGFNGFRAQGSYRVSICLRV